MAAQVASSQFDAAGCGHAFVLREPLAKVTARRCAACAADVFGHSRAEVRDEDVATILDVCADARCSAIRGESVYVGGFKAALAFAKVDPAVVVVNVAGARLHDFLPRTRAPFDALRAAGRCLDLEWEDADDFVLDAGEVLRGCRWIAERAGGGARVVVSCAQGKSRSGALAVAFGMYAALRAANPGFARRLGDLEAGLRAAGRADRAGPPPT